MKITDELAFQLLDVDYYHDENDDGDKEFKIRLFGKTKEDKSVYLEASGFRPFFYVEIQNDFRKTHVEMIIDHIKEKVWPKECVEGYIDYEIVEKHKFWGFTNYKLFNFVKLSFRDYDSMRAFARTFTKRRYKIPFIPGPKKGTKFKLYESNIIPFLRYLHIQGLDAVGWCKVATDKLVDFDEFLQPAQTDYQYKVRWSDVHPIESTDIHDFNILSFDLECTSEDGSFPQHKRPGDKIIQIGMTYSKCSQTECYRKILLSLKKTGDIDGVEVISCKSEKELLLTFSKLIRETDPDILTGYNIYGFDFPYLHGRAKLLGIQTKFARLSRLKNHVCKFIEKDLESSALGKNKMFYYQMEGRVSIDLMKVAQRDYRLGSYKLDYVSSHFIREKIKKYKNKTDMTRLYVDSTFGIKADQYISIYYNDGITDNNVGNKKYHINKIGITKTTGKDGEKVSMPFIDIDDPDLDLQEYLDRRYKVYWCQAKDDVTPQQIFESYEGTSKDRALVGKYCIQDCELCNRLMGKLSILTNNIGMANVCNVPLSYLFLRGQGIKIFSLVAKKCREENHLIPVIRKKQKKKTEEELQKEALQNKNFAKFVNYLTYKGGNNDGDSDDEEEEEDEGYEGAIVLEPVTGVHYKPIPVLDFASLYPNSMILKNLSHESHVMDDRYDNLPGYIYHEIKYTKNSGDLVTCRFAEKEDGTKAIIPKILQYLLDTRKKYKRLMGAEKNPFKKNIYNGLQLAYKVTANSLYGQTGASTSPICKKEIAASTTATGRDMLLYAKYFIEEIYSKILLYAITGKKKTMRKFIEDLFKDVPPHKLVDKKKGYDDLKSFIKWVYEEANELLVGHTVDPKVIYGDSVVGDTPIITRTGDDIQIRKISDIGGTWSEYGDKESCDMTDTHVWTEKGWTKIKKVIRHSTKKKIYRVTTHTGSVDVTEDHSLLDKNGNKITPDECEVGTELTQSFPDDMYACPDMDRIDEMTTYVCNGKLAAQKILYREKRRGYNVSVKTDPDDPDKYILTSTYKRHKDTDCKIKKIDDVSEYYYEDEDEITVYDLETENHHFHAGVGDIIVHNTDSVFFCMNIVDKKTGEALKNHKALEMSIKLGLFASDIVNALMPSPMVLEYEKVLWPFIILTKKRYVGNLYEFDPNSYYQKCMGIVMKRRDNAPIVKIVVGGIIDKIINERDPEAAVEFTRNTLQKIITGQYHIDKFIITKTLKSLDSYKDWHRITHAVLANRMSIRDPGNAPQSNDRIPYAFVEVEGKVKLQGDRVEHPDYINKHDLKLDYLYYITNQIMKPSLQFLELIAHNPEDIFKDYIIKERNRQKGMAPICSLIGKSGDSEVDEEEDARHERVFDAFMNTSNFVDFSNMNMDIDDPEPEPTVKDRRRAKKSEKSKKTKKKKKSEKSEKSKKSKKTDSETRPKIKKKGKKRSKIAKVKKNLPSSGDEDESDYDESVFMLSV